MKKLLVSLCAALLVTVCCIGCASNTPRDPEFVSPRPWHASLTFEKETATYKVTKRFMDSEEGTTVSQSGKLTYTLTEKEESDGVYCILNTEFTITYLADSEFLSDDYKGKTDTIKSEVKFRSDTLTCAYSHKTVSLESEPNKSYEYYADYDKGEASFGNPSLESENKKTIPFKKGNYIDNEYLYYYVRSIKDVADSSTHTFDVVNWYECFLSGSFKQFNMAVQLRTVENVKLETPAEFIKNEGFKDSGKNADDNSLKCNTIMIGLSGEKMGLPIYASYAQSEYTQSKSENGFTDTKTAYNILTKISTSEYTTKGKLNYITDFVLSGFSQEFSK